ncbi:MAG: GntR family transcriptional regulator [Alphaproteobacteria bacterium]|nr:GntR family transcriptional regulator [Alphaproteobacteria bacterium]
MPLPFNTTIPLYRQIAQVLLARAQSGMAAGPALPSEVALTAEFGVSRTTIRQALDLLKREKLLQSRRGVGTRFVRAPEIPKVVASSGDPLHAGLGTTPRVLATERLPAPADAAAFFEIASGDEIWRIMRLHELDDEPLSVVISYLPVEYASVLTQAALRKPLHESLWEHFGIAQHHSDHAIRVARADEFLARTLKVGLTDPLLHVRSAVRLDDGRPIRWTHNYFREDRYQYVAEVIWQPPRGQSHDTDTAI